MSETQPLSKEQLAASSSSVPPGRASVPLLLLLGALTVLAVYAAGWPGMDSPWLPGDEAIFIFDNPDVVGDSQAPLSFWKRCARIFTKVHEDLYQPIPIFTYAVEMAVWGDQPFFFRQTDVLLHALNALLLWRVLRALLRHARPADDGLILEFLSWMLATLWALHPVLVSTYASDMGRTHLLSTMFALISLGLYCKALNAIRANRVSIESANPLSRSHISTFPHAQASGTGCLIGALAALVLAMLCKPLPGWFGFIFVLEAAWLGWRAVWRSPRIYLVALIGIVFAGLAYWTSRQAGIIEDSTQVLFGDPFCRSALAVWLYARNLLAPFWLAAWYPPDPHTTWTNPRVWGGVLLTVASCGHAIRAWRRTETRTVTVGWTWCWALLLPVIGLIGAREIAARDSYLYQSSMGLLLVAGAVLAPKIMAAFQANPNSKLQTPKFILLGATAVLGGAMLLWDLPRTEVARSAIRRARQVVELNPGDPRALEMLADAGYDPARNHPIPTADYPKEMPADPAQREAYQYSYFTRKLVTTLIDAASARNLETYFPNTSNRAPFHRRLSYRFRLAGDFSRALEQAQISRDLQPDSPFTWSTLATAYQLTRQWNDALEAYRQYEARLPTDESQPPSLYERALRLIEMGSLLVQQLDQPAEAYRKYAAAIALLQRLDNKPDQRRKIEDARRVARIGLALCEVRAGQGINGFQIIQDVLKNGPRDVDALLVLGEYHLRSHHWNDAGATYGMILEMAYRTPGVVRETQLYRALRGYQEICAQTGQWRPAVEAWKEAVRRAPDNRVFRSFCVWSLACAGDEATVPATEALFATDPNNPFGCLARMLVALRENKIADAVRWAKFAAKGQPISDARPAERAATTLRLMLDRNQLPPEAAIAEAVLRAQAGDREKARQLLGQYLEQSPNGAARETAQECLDELSDNLEKP